MVLQPCEHLLVVGAIALGHQLDVGAHLCGQLLLTDAAETFVCRLHGDVVQVVELAEHAHLREFRDARDEHELQMVVEALQRGEQILEAFAHEGLLLCITDTVEHHRVVLVAEHYHATPRLFMGSTDDVYHTRTGAGTVGCKAVQFLIIGQRLIYIFVQFRD